jgi:ABC-type glycerol-3-phosphate transport system substrate-binding protein
VGGLTDLINLFQAEHPAVEFSLSYIPADELEVAIREAAVAGELPSIFLAPSPWGPELGAQGVILDLSPSVTAEIQRSLHPLAWSQVAFQNEVLGLPVRMHGNVLYRNRSLAQIPAASLPDLLETSRRLRGTTSVGAALDFGYLYTVPQSEACGGGLLSPGSQPAVEGALGLCWLTVLRDLSRAGPVVFNTEEDLQLFLAGGAAWFVGSTELYPLLVRSLGEANLAVDSWPTYPGTGGRMAGYVWTENAYLSAALQGPDLQAAWSFALRMISPEAQLSWSQTARGAHLPTFALAEPTEAAVAAMHAAVRSGTALPLWSLDPIHIEILERAARAVSLQGADPETAQRRAVEELHVLSQAGDQPGG